MKFCISVFWEMKQTYAGCMQYGGNWNQSEYRPPVHHRKNHLMEIFEPQE